mgnify:CR=1 FL=1
MDLAIINMISDLKFYYNLMYYLINTKMNNNLKIILTTDIVRYASMVNFEVNKFFKKDYNHEIVPLDIVYLGIGKQPAIAPFFIWWVCPVIKIKLINRLGIFYWIYINNIVLIGI